MSLTGIKDGLSAGDCFRCGVFIIDRESVVMRKWQILEFDGKPYYAFVPEGDTPLPIEEIPEEVDGNLQEVGDQHDELGEQQEEVEKKAFPGKIENYFDEENTAYDSMDEKLYEEENLYETTGEMEEIEPEDIKPIILNGTGENGTGHILGDLYQVKVQGSTVTIEKLLPTTEMSNKNLVDDPEESEVRHEDVEYLDEALQDDVTGSPRQSKSPKGSPGGSLKCKVCSETFSSAISFRKHVAWTHKKKVCVQEDGAYICAVCDYRTLKKSLFAAHLERKHETWSRKRPSSQLFPCAACGFVCRSKHSLQSHFIRKHTDSYEHHCKFCAKKFKVKGDLTNHVRFHHKEKPVNCDVCGKLCQNSGSLYVHQKWAHYKPKFECHICKRRMVTQENLDQHLLTQHEKREKIVCAECGKTFTKKDSFKRHMAVHTGCKPHSCLICHKPFARRSQLRQHLLIHTGKRPFVCDICGKAFTQKPGLICHRKTHPGQHPPLPVMPIADIVKEFTEGYVQEISARGQEQEELENEQEVLENEQEVLENEQDALENEQVVLESEDTNRIARGQVAGLREGGGKRVTSGREVALKRPRTAKRFSCDLCEYSSGQKSNLETHRRRHARDYAFRCDECRKGFVTRQEFAQHLDAHDGERRYPCQLCERAYLYRKNLQAHVRMHHRPDPEDTRIRAGHECGLCQESFVYAKLLERHLKSRHGVAKDCPGFLCEICGVRLGSKKRLTVHRRAHGSEKAFVCDACGRGFTCKENLKIHARTHTGEKPYKCVQCSRGFAQRTSLVLHLRYHAEERPHVCRECGKGFVSGAILRKHRKAHESVARVDNKVRKRPRIRFSRIGVPDPLRINDRAVLEASFLNNETYGASEKTCEHCPARFHFVTRLVAHLRIVHGISRPFVCRACGKSYPQQFMLNAHVKKSHTPKTVPCGQCTFMGVDAVDVDRHRKRRHRSSQDAPHGCEICGEIFREQSDATRHAAMHDFAQIQQCQACGTTFNDVCSLKEHNRLYHYDPSVFLDGKVSDGERTGHKCETCGKIYKYKSILKQHQSKAHGGGNVCERRRFLCALCGKELKTAKGLEIHNRSHTGEKPFTCEVCGKCFACETLLRTHSVTHTGERKYACEQCGKAFTQRSTLVVHRRYHTGERPYVCEQCGKGFVTRTVLNTHVKSCH